MTYQDIGQISTQFICIHRNPPLKFPILFVTRPLTRLSKKLCQELINCFIVELRHAALVQSSTVDNLTSLQLLNVKSIVPKITILKS